MDVKMWDSQITRAEFSESICRLQRLRRVPESPQENSSSHLIQSSRRLSIPREQEISSSLAFIAATTKDPRKVMAVCVEEHTAGEEITIRLASNHGDLSEIVDGFKALAAIMMKAAHRESSKLDDTDSLFREILKLDFSRILSRLRSRHGKTKPGQPQLIKQFAAALDDRSQESSAILRKGELDSLKAKGTDLSFTFAKLEAMNLANARSEAGIVLLMDIVKQAYEISKSAILSTIFHKSAIDPSLTQHISHSMGKLGKYYSVALELISAARNKSSRLFQTINVEPFQIPDPPTVQKCVHAEIQLLFFYETHPRQDRPRIIASSKSACYLCNLFFKIHGGFHVPRTHGRIYENWTLPDWLEVGPDQRQHLTACLNRMKAVLIERIQAASRLPRPRLNDPAESVVLEFAHWPSTSAISKSINASNVSSSRNIRPASLNAQKTSPERLLACINPPSTPPHTPVVLPISTTHKNQPPLGASSSTASNTMESLALSGSSPTLIVSREQLPYSQSIGLCSPSMQLSLAGLLLTFDFVGVYKGQIFIEQADTKSMVNEECNIVEIEAIPTAESLQLGCPNHANELAFQLKYASRGNIELVNIRFVWLKK